MVKSRSEDVIFHPASFLVIHYSELYLILPIMEAILAKFHKLLITITHSVLCIYVMYPSCFPAEGIMQTIKYILQYIHINPIKENG